VLVRYFFWDEYLVFYPFGVFPESHAGEELRVVGMVVEAGDGTDLVESVDEHPFRVKISESQRTVYRLHATFPSPLFDGLYEGFGHFEILDEVDESEPDTGFTGLAVADMVDDGDDASYGFAVPFCQENLMVIHFQRRIMPFE